MTYRAVITNTGAVAVDLIYHNSLPAGLNQWSARYRLDKGSWNPYPANGLIPLGTLAAGTSLSMDLAPFGRAFKP